MVDTSKLEKAREGGAGKATGVPHPPLEGEEVWAKGRKY
jgi:hypothetical protein